MLLSAGGPRRPRPFSRARSLRAERDPAKADAVPADGQAAETQAGNPGQGTRRGPCVRAVAPVAAHRLAHRHLRSARHAAGAVGIEGARRLRL